MLAPLIKSNKFMYIDVRESWMNLIKAFYSLENDWLNKKSFSMPLLMFLNEEKANYVLWELHEDWCPWFGKKMW